MYMSDVDCMLGSRVQVETPKCRPQGPRYCYRRFLLLSYSFVADAVQLHMLL